MWKAKKKFKHNFQASSPISVSANLARNIASTLSTVDTTGSSKENFQALLQRGLTWVTVVGPTNLAPPPPPKNSSQLCRMQQSIGISQNAKRLASQNFLQGEGFCDMWGA